MKQRKLTRKQLQAMFAKSAQHGSSAKTDLENFRAELKEVDEKMAKWEKKHAKKFSV